MVAPAETCKTLRSAGEGTAAIPVTLLTGFLGAGKTSLVNHILAAAHGRRLAVIVNEFGELAIDGTLVAGASGSVIELANGCICCAMQGQLARALQDVLMSGKDLDGILVETSGLADPYPVIGELEDIRFAQPTQLDGIIAVIDAANFDRNLDSAEAAFHQITCADVLLVNKVDMVEADIPGRIAEGIRTLNPQARVLSCVACDVPLEVVLGPSRRLLAEPAPTPAAAHGAAHHHDEFASVVLRLDGAVDPQRLASWLERLPPSVFRAKGFVRLSTARSLFAVNAVGVRYSLDPAPANKPDIAGVALVLIGRSMPIAQLNAELIACAA